MSTTVTRLFSSSEHAEQAISQLRGHGLYDSEINKVTSASGDVSAALAGAGVRSADLKTCAEAVAKGATLVAATARFGLASGAMRIMDGCSPMNIQLAHGEHFNRGETDATPLSSFLDIPTLSRTKSPFAAFWNLPELSSGRTPFSSLFGLPALLKAKNILPQSRRRSGPTPLSSLLGLSTISRSPTPLSSALGFRLLKNPPPRRH